MPSRPPQACVGQSRHRVNDLTSRTRSNDLGCAESPRGCDLLWVAGNCDDARFGLHHLDRRDGREADRTRSVDKDCRFVSVRRVFEDGMERHTEWIGEDRLLVSHVGGQGKNLTLMDRHPCRVGAGGILAISKVQPWRKIALVKVFAKRKVSRDTCWANRRDSARLAGKPGVDDDTVARAHARDAGTDLSD